MRANAAQGITRFFVTDDNFARNSNWELILDRLIDLPREGRVSHPAVPAGRYAVPSHSGLHRKIGARRLHRRLHRLGEHQSRISDGHQEAPEQDLGISRDAAGLEAGQGADLCGLYPGLPDRHPGIRSRATSRSSSTSCRSTCSSSFASRRCRAPRTTRSCICAGCRWTPIWNNYDLEHACTGQLSDHVRARRPGSGSMRMPGNATIRTRMWRPSCAAPPSPGSTRPRFSTA